VHNTTIKLAPNGPMKEIGNVFCCILYLLDDVKSDEVIMLSKIDLLDGFWCMLVDEGEVQNFCYIMTDLPGAPIHIVVPSALQMGWAKSPA
jgi:hypothetical protein